jgi:hypothetical protein
MPSLRSHPRTNFLLGAFLFSGLGFGFGLFPWITQTVQGGVSAALAAVAMLAVLLLVSRKERAAAGPDRPFLPALLSKIGVLLLGALAAALLIRGTGELRWRSQAAQAAREGYLPEDQKNAPAIPEAQNAVTWLKKLEGDTALDKWMDEKLGGKNFGLLLVTYVTGLRSRPEPAETQAMLSQRKRFKPYLDLLDKAAACPGVNWGVDHGVAWYKVEIPKFSPLMKLARLNAAEAGMLTREGRVQEADARVAKGLWLAKAIRQEQFLISSMVAIAIDRITLNAAQAVLRKGGGGWTGSLDPAAPAAHVLIGLKREHFGNPIHFVQLGPVEMARLMDSDILVHPGRLWPHPFWPFVAHEIADDLAYNRGLMQSYLGPAAGRHARSLERKAQEGRGVRRPWVYSENVNINGFNFYEKAMEDAALQGLAKAAAKAYAFKKARQRWPDKVEELGSADEIRDPGSDLPFKLLKNGSQLALYGCGLDGDDDGGKPVTPNSSDDGDLLWEL